MKLLGRDPLSSRLYEIIGNGCGAAGSLLAVQQGDGFRERQLSDDRFGAPVSSLASPELTQTFHWHEPMIHFLFALSSLVANRSTHHKF